MDNKALFDITYGLYVVTAASGAKKNGQIANTVFQLTSEPISMCVSINKQNFTHGIIREGDRFCVSILAQDTPMELVGLFGFRSGKDTDKFEGVQTITAEGGSPVLTEHCIGYLECKVSREVDLGTHTMFIGELSDARVLHKGKPMTYAYYHEVKKGTTPKNAPTYRGTEENASQENQGQDARVYRCPICGYLYDPAEGDPEHHIKAGTAFEDLPSDWKCPICAAPKKSFLPQG